MKYAPVMLALVLVGGCSGFIARRAADSTYQLVQASAKVAQRLPDVTLAREAVPGGVMQLAAFASAYPDHAGFRTLYADAVCNYALAFVYDDWDAATLAGHRDVADPIADRLRILLPMCVDANRARLAPARRATPLAQLAATTTKAEAAPLLWIAQATAVELALDPLVHLADLPAIEAALATCVRLAPGARDAAAELTIATLLASKPAIAGGDPSGAGFARARALAGEGALLVDVMEAHTAAVARKDRAAFERLLDGVLAADVTKWPDRRLGNELARAKARRYRAAEALLFGDAP